MHTTHPIAQTNRLHGAPHHLPHVTTQMRQPTATAPSHDDAITLDRRHHLMGGLLASVAAVTTLLTPPPPAFADDSPLPEGYLKTARSLIEALRDAVDMDLSGAPEIEVRRKADPAKDLVRQFMSRWREAPIVRDDVSYAQLTGAIRDLGEFYTKNGQRSRLSEKVGQTLLARLEAAENALPPAPEKKSLLPF